MSCADSDVFCSLHISAVNIFHGKHHDETVRLEENWECSQLPILIRTFKENWKRFELSGIENR